MRKDDSSIYFINELPQNINSFKALVSPHSHNGCLVIFDDYELEVSENISFFHQIWTVLSHHWNFTPILVLHNLFAKELRTISLNTHRIVLTKSLRDTSQIDYLSRQCFPDCKKFLVSVYKKCFQMQDYPYLILNFSPGKESENYIKVMTKIFEHESPMTVFKPYHCSSGKKSNPYEQLVLIDQTLYNVLMNGNLDYQKKKTLDQNNLTSLASNNNSIQIRNINESHGDGNLSNSSNLSQQSEFVEESGFNSNRTSERENTKQQIPRNSEQSLEVTQATVEGNNEEYNRLGKMEKDREENKENTPFSIKPMNELFKKNTSHDVIDDSLKDKRFRKKRYRINKNNAHKKRPPPLNVNSLEKKTDLNVPSTSASPTQNNSITTAENTDLERKSKKGVGESDKPLENKLIDKNISAIKTIPRREVKRKAPQKINRFLHPFKKRKMSEEKLSEKKQKQGHLKRKAQPIINREIYPFKTKKYNQGEKRKLSFSTKPAKHFKDERFRDYLPNQIEYDKWDL